MLLFILETAIKLPKKSIIYRIMKYFQKYFIWKH